ncbi:dienelactone hydrolase [Catenuloplanes nepalensis]|uniref:Dienelactone hydrolase n=1 Tax=Catenuloplanes nepalensis TaxID=587533 RepID=A0ABT9MT62_9ACTN|nr:dienelactone hydrolase family protein [Catenuloplanes nepalensis]MDP9794630.1 dienelactone hydrolase [Catenuloplanes nepalensis]
MTEIVLFHHVLGLTDGVRALAARFEQAGHTVHTPDLFEGRTFGTLEEGLAHAQEIGFSRVVERGRAAADALPEDVVYAGISLGVMSAQMLAQTRPGARGALLLEAAVPPGEFGSWPASVPVQVHGMDNDPSFAGEGDLDAARDLVKEAADGELFLYPGNVHLFTDSSLPSYDAAATAQVVERALTLLTR